MTAADKIKVVRLVAVHYQHPDLESACAFLRDFGMSEVLREDKRIYFGGYGRDPYLYIAEQSPTARRAFLGGTWAVDSLDDLTKAASKSGASAILDAEGPGGGKKVTLNDPNGFPITFIHGQALKEPQDHPATRALDKESPVMNHALEKPRKGRFLRFNKGPSPVHKLGHYGYIVPKDDFIKTREWYQSLFNLVTSDSVFNPETGEDSTSFMHIDLGETFTDHHSLFLGANPTNGKAFVHHSSFEINDFDSQALGHNWLSEKGYTNCWGIGRHVLGSQIFDYWFDTSGNILEHYSDGDLVNKHVPSTRSPEAPDSLHIWGPNVPLTFITGQPDK
ncbi:related to 2,3-dihydroxybiphenyl-1,2-dioxygenase [Fusarium fujikuroi]|uniref:Related to 2,3-dihydroxybiphenyl-1,2-dioxygenase n=2 Tax=Fusarium fujikuroi TaxID=5127 RepID=S0EGF6_GIBF5|nr:related to 2,3-dihydroxybiphenyl-1,2-dioxygenase [Fusarium fujikuroi IMI 58289]KLP11982.1 2,3-dihydroxybiphenyl-1,2-dioxygenase [Fusarium fujikuroi]QGI68532.1 hypothetical protein CEK27_012503 [Fusarium fujikuroi]QGI85728.1 hypothetical protein CEK25_012457 [Fusarium fujikuroi]QGI99424.1 hypothetical protein CEK26_012493 [Fusarium fujikuroi]CCT72912.1 related to 2,3-dihydroxybiphenyl-1,2-dioxygenase [Fusarium fujikuroi IMI 58289]